MSQVLSSLSLLRLKAFVLWPLVMFGLAIAGWNLEVRMPVLSWVLFGLLVWVLFFRAYRDQIRLYKFRCPHCGEYFLRRPHWTVRPMNVWSNRCVNCHEKAI
jgi:hypothetical protein